MLKHLESLDHMLACNTQLPVRTSVKHSQHMEHHDVEPPARSAKQEPDQLRHKTAAETNAWNVLVTSMYGINIGHKHTNTM
jgi:hypothetical protein